MGFFVTLPSTASADIFPNNKQTDYTTRLAQPVQLQGSHWSVGLSEIHIPVSWYNVDDTNDRFVISVERQKVRLEEKIPPPLKIEVKKRKKKAQLQGFEIYKQLNSQIPQGYDVRFEVDVLEPNKVHIILGPGVSLVFPPESAATAKMIFGLTEAQLPQLTADFTGQLDEMVSDTAPILELDTKPVMTFMIIPTLPKMMEVLDTITVPLELKIAHGRYEAAEELFAEMRNAIPEADRDLFRFQLLPSNFTVITVKAPALLMFSSTNKGLAEMLGFDLFDEFFDSARSKYPLDMKRGINGIYVYTDLIAPQFIGDTYAPLLRVVNPSIRTANDESIVMLYDRPDYYPLSRNVFETIRLYMRTDDGEPLAFKYGKVLVKLHFKQHHESRLQPAQGL